MKKLKIFLVLGICGAGFTYAPSKKVVKKESDDELLRAYCAESNCVRKKEHVSKSERSQEVLDRFKDMKIKQRRACFVSSKDKDENTLTYIYGTNQRVSDFDIAKMLNSNYLVGGYFTALVKAKKDKETCRNQLEHCVRVFNSGDKVGLAKFVLKNIASDKFSFVGMRSELAGIPLELIDTLPDEFILSLCSRSFVSRNSSNDDE